MRRLFFTFCLVTVFNLFGQEKGDLHFKNGRFKIMQITDTHVNSRSENSAKTVETIAKIIEIEQPDFIIITGDMIVSKPAIDGLKILTNPIVQSQIPWTATFGNHDEELDLSKKEIWNFFQTLPNFIGEIGTVSGVGNNVFPIYSSQNKGKIASVIYTFDSQDYSRNSSLGYYGWVKFDQIDWYRKQSDILTAKNNGKSLPGMAFFHIPLPEFKEMAADEKELVGEKFEGIASPEINTGLFASFIEKKDVMGAFVGHDHDNNYVGIYRNIALGFGQVSGSNAYGKLERGCRIVELTEGEHTFKTWIRTPNTKKFPFYYPSGMTEPNADTRISSAIIPPKKLKNGVKYQYFEGAVEKTEEIKNLPLKKAGISQNFNLKMAEVKDSFALRFESFLKIPETAFYKFHTLSDDGSILKINGEIVVDNDGSHNSRRKNGVIALEKGFHKIEVLYFEKYMGQELSVGVTSKSIPEQEIPAEFLFYSE